MNEQQRQRARNFTNRLACNLVPCDETMKAIRLFSSELPAFIEKEREELAKEMAGELVRGIPTPENWLDWTNEERRAFLKGARAARLVLTKIYTPDIIGERTVWAGVETKAK